MTKAFRNPLRRRDLFKWSGATAGMVAAAGAAGVLTSTSAHAQMKIGDSKLTEVLDRGRLIVATGSTNPPWHFEDASGNLQGMDIDMARLLAKGLFNDESKVEFIKGNPDTRIPNLVTNKADIVIQFMTVTPGRAQQVAFTIPYYREGVGVLLLKTSPFNSLEELAAKGSAVTISALQNVFIEEWVHKGLPQAKVDQYESIDASLQALNAKRADGQIADLSNLRWQIKQFPNRFKDAGSGWMPNSYAAAVKPGDPIWLDWVNSVFREALMGVDFDTMKASYKKWFDIDVATPKIGFPVEYS